MSTRAAAATLSLRAKQDLIRILFGTSSSESSASLPSAAYQATKARAPLNTATATATGAERPQHSRDQAAHRQCPVLDHSEYSYSDLRTAYLERLQLLHPDKHKAFQSTNRNTSSTIAMSESCEMPKGHSSTSRFIELLNAWNRYDAVAKHSNRRIPHRTTKHDNEQQAICEANFTMFGVGCSFSDTDEERDLRAKIMDQAARGWFPAAELDAVATDTSTSTLTSTPHDTIAQATKKDDTRLTCDAMFQASTGSSKSTSSNYSEGGLNDNRNNSTTTTATDRRQCSLVGHLIPPHRR